MMNLPLGAVDTTLKYVKQRLYVNIASPKINMTKFYINIAWTKSSH